MLAASQDGSCVECLESQLQGDEQIEQTEQNEQTEQTSQAQETVTTRTESLNICVIQLRAASCSVCGSNVWNYVVRCYLDFAVSCNASC